MERTEYKVGEEFQVGFKTLKCVEGQVCEGCFLRGKFLDCCILEEFIGPCISYSREDGKDVIFVEGEENETQYQVEGEEMEMTESPCRLIECIYLNKAGISKGCTVSYPANGWVLNNGLVEDLVKERKKDFVKLVSFEIK